MVLLARRDTGPKPSKYIPKDMENELRVLVMDAVEGFPIPIANFPQLIIGNVESGCHGVYLYNPTKFAFHHCKMECATQCKCVVQDTHVESTYRLPADLEEYRQCLINGTNVPFRLESKLAAMVVMKIFLGMVVPEPLRMKTTAQAADPANGPENLLEDETGANGAEQDLVTREEDEKDKDEHCQGD
ncbi:hypothetical protein GGS21DRAFT_524095 [Xylaria nigripes]|nr:hypothetical protein GGS21DRAFT_524095 [Xylaria nigripes]